jgi:hypothetical protein
VGEFFRRLWKSGTDSPYPPELFLATFRFRRFDLQSPAASILKTLLHCSDSRGNDLKQPGGSDASKIAPLALLGTQSGTCR